MQMHVKRVALLGSLSATLAIAGPVASASAAPAGPGLFPAGVSGQLIFGPAVVGAVVTTTAPSSFINSNIQDSVGGNAAGVQVTGL